MSSTTTVHFRATESRGDVSGLLIRPSGASSLLVLGHGAGAGMTHPFLQAFADRLAERGAATLRYQFPYMEAATKSKKRRRPDFAPVLEATVRSAVAAALEHAGDLPVFAGGKSMGGRMTSRAEAKAPLAGVRGLVLLGFPLHPAGKPGVERAEHLADVKRPMLFLQGDRDRLAELGLLEPVLEQLDSRPHLHVVAGGDHSFQVLKRSGRTAEDVLDELVEVTTGWIAEVLVS